jgi:hypothetical protein
MSEARPKILAYRPAPMRLAFGMSCLGRIVSGYASLQRGEAPKSFSVERSSLKSLALRRRIAREIFGGKLVEVILPIALMIAA